MKKHRSLFGLLLIIVIVGLLCCTISADSSDIESPSSNLTNTTIIQNTTDRLRYYPFVYRDDDGFKWFRDNIIQSNECEVGYLYVKDLETCEIWKVLDCKVDYIRETNDRIYCVINGNTLVVTDYAGNNISTLHSAKQAIRFVETYNDDVFWVEGDNVIHFDPNKKVITLLANCKNIVSIFPVGQDEFIWSNTEDITYLTKAGTRLEHRLISEEELRTQYLSTEVVTPNVNSGTLEISSTVSQPTLPLSGYASGTYYTDNGRACTDHNTGSCDYYGGCNCKSYNSSIQCMGFAKFASDQYAHRSSWTKPSGDFSSTDVELITDSDVLVYLSVLPAGSFLALENSIGNVHCLVTILAPSAQGGYIYTYECNYAGPCMISTQLRTPYQFRTSYRYVTDSLIHQYYNYTYVNTYYHKVSCRSVGCSGYIYELHYSSNGGSPFTCDGCGATGCVGTVTASRYNGFIQ